MVASIRTQIAIDGPQRCPIAKVSNDEGVAIEGVTRSSGTTKDGTLTEEFSVNDVEEIDDPAIDPVFNTGKRRVYRLERSRDLGCICDTIERYGSPVFDVFAEDGTLVVTFHAPDIETVREIVAELDLGCNGLRVRQLTAANEDGNDDYVLVDRGRLTDRQREVLETSFSMGYFDHPKRSNAGDVADKMDISPSTYREHLAAAQRKLFETIVED